MQAADAASYSLRISNRAGTVTSEPATLTVVGAPAITAQPQAATGTVGATVRFAVAASGSALRYQWTRNHVAIPGATAADYTPPALTLADDGALFGVVVYNGAGIAFSEQALLSVQPAPVVSAEGKIAAGLNHTCAVHGSNALYCWGNGVNGELGNGTAEFRAVPTRVGGALGSVKTVAAGGLSSCAIDTADMLWCWGALNDSVSPARVFTEAIPVRDVALGLGHVCLINAFNGLNEVACWGRNDFGQLGTGSTAAESRPTAVRRADGSPLRGALSIAVGDNHSCALLADGSVWCWGADTAFNARVSPQRVLQRLPDQSTMDFTATGRLAGGGAHVCALESSTGQPMCWGHNAQGQLGDGTTISRDDAKPVGLFGGIGLAAGPSHTCAVRATDMICWGQAFMGNGGEREQLLEPLGAGRVDAFTNSPDAVRVAAVGERHTCALRASGDVQCWGWNNAGQAGIGSWSDTVNVLVPTSTTLGAEFWGR